MIELHNISVQKNGRQILQDISFTIERGDKILIGGESGSGKSTLLKSILFFESFSGTIHLDKNPVQRDNLSHFRQIFAYLGQNLPSFDKSVNAFIRYPFQFHSNHDKNFDHRRMMSLIESLNFEEDILEKNFSDLSGGERQRIAIIQVLMLDKKVYLLDEITSALDPVNIRNVIKTLTDDPRRTLVSVSHDQHWDDVPLKKIVLSKGRMTVMEKQIGR